MGSLPILLDTTQPIHWVSNIFLYYYYFIIGVRPYFLNLSSVTASITVFPASSDDILLASCLCPSEEGLKGLSPGPTHSHNSLGKYLLSVHISFST